jgi:hypothetical protein
VKAISGVRGRGVIALTKLGTVVKGYLLSFSRFTGMAREGNLTDIIMV